MRIVISGGGTGGHVYPALAIAEALHELESSIEIHFLGTQNGFEHNAVNKAGEKFHSISAGGIVGKNPAAKLRGLLNAGLGVWQSFKLLLKLRPNLVIGTGGFVMAPVLMAANWLRIPTLLQEQNSFPGYATRKFASHAQLVCLGLEDAKQHLGNAKTKLTGNPLRKALVAGASVKRRENRNGRKPRLFVVGGSLGAKSLNHAIAEGLHDLVTIADVTWQYGKSGIPQSVSQELITDLQKSGKLQAAAFYDDMQTRYAEADIILCRAGAMTLSEIAMYGLPAILVPFPFAAHQHQLANARSIENAGAAKIVLDSDLSGKTLVESVKQLFDSPTDLPRMSQAMKSLARPQAAQDIAQLALDIAKL
jgi:UDP-N-acetylglucosamine--N-acetylmuramyl-(pentapeptide) pyrophosphoryl-undecaprenol N-acetylglucosamine transferase